MSEVQLRVPSGPLGDAVLRRVVRALAASTALPIDRVDDLAIICEEILARSTASPSEFTFRCDAGHITLETPVVLAATAGAVLNALANDVRETSDEEGRPVLQVRVAAHANDSGTDRDGGSTRN